MNVSYLGNTACSVFSDFNPIERIRSFHPEDTGREAVIKFIFFACIMTFVIGLIYYFTRVSRLQSKGDGLVKEGKFDAAKIEYKKALKISPKDIKSLISYGKACSDHGKALRAEEKSEEAEKQFTKAEKQYKKALEAKPDDEIALESYGDLLKEQGKDDEAATQYTHAEDGYKKALEVNPKSGKALNTYGDFLKRQKRFEEATEQFHKKLQNDPGNPYALAYYGDALMLEGKFEEAAQHYKKAWHINSTELQHHTSRHTIKRYYPD